MDFHSIGKWLIGFGLLIAAAGVVISLLPRVPWLGRLPGDLYIKNDHVSFYFPLTTCLILSVAASLLYRLFKR